MLFNENFLTFNSGNNTNLILGFYSGKNRTAMTETVSNLMIKEYDSKADCEADSEAEYVPYEVFPCKTTSVISSNGNHYDIPPEIQERPGYGHKDSVVDFMNLTYSYKTTDGETFSSIPTVISIADIISEAPHLEAESEGTITFDNSQNEDIETSILYKKDVEPIDVIDNLNSTDSTAALSANMGRELNERTWGYTGSCSEEELIYGINIGHEWGV
jgi:hypothetical protein